MISISRKKDGSEYTDSRRVMMESPVSASENAGGSDRGTCATSDAAPAHKINAIHGFAFVCICSLRRGLRYTMYTLPGMPPASRISLVIPAYNEAGYLPRLLESVDAARARYAHGAHAVDVIVADNASTDATAAIARAHGCRVVHVAKRVIGAARNGGARIARGEFLAFIDADSRIHPETFNVIDRTLADPRIVAGTTSIGPDRWSIGLVAVFLTLAPIAFLFTLDTGVVYCRRADFEAIGGYTEEWLYGEDVRLLLDLRRLGRRRGQRLTRTPAARAIASTRKFDKYGDWHYLLLPGRLAWDLIRDRSAVRTFARQYWYEDR